MRPTATLALLLALAPLHSASTADWPRWRGPDLNGISREAGLNLQWEEEPETLWSAQIGSGYSSVSVADGRVFTLGLEEAKQRPGVFRKPKGTEVVRCLDEATGRVLWTHSYPSQFKPKFYDGGTSGTPTVDDEQLYVFGQSGELMCLNVANGEVIWQKNLAGELGLELGVWGLTGSPLVLGELLILNAGTHGTAVRKSDGKVVWTSGGGKNGYATPVPFEIDGESLLAVFSAGGLYAVDPDDGQRLWNFEWETKYDVNAADPIPMPRNRMFISSGYGRGAALLKMSPGGAELLWENINIRTQFNPAVYINGYLYGIDGNTSDGNRATLVCIDPADGSVKWSEQTGFGGVTAVDDVLVVLNESGELITASADPEGYRELARMQAISKKCWTIPTVANGKIFVRNHSGKLVVLSVKS